jgi:hypothetical protein
MLIARRKNALRRRAVLITIRDLIRALIRAATRRRRDDSSEAQNTTYDKH